MTEIKNVPREVVLNDLRPTIPPSCPAHVAALIEMLWRREPAARPSFEACLEYLAGSQAKAASDGKGPLKGLLSRFTVVPPERAGFAPSAVVRALPFPQPVRCWSPAGARVWIGDAKGGVYLVDSKLALVGVGRATAGCRHMTCGPDHHVWVADELGFLSCWQTPDAVGGSGTHSPSRPADATTATGPEQSQRAVTLGRRRAAVSRLPAQDAEVGKPAASSPQAPELAAPAASAAPIPLLGALMSVQPHRDQRVMALVDCDGVVVACDTKGSLSLWTARDTATVLTAPEPLVALCSTPQSVCVAAATSGKRLFRVTAKKIVAIGTELPFRVVGGLASAGRDRVWACGERVIGSFDLGSGLALRSLSSPALSACFLSIACINVHGKATLFAAGSRELSIWNPQTGGLLRVLKLSLAQPSVISPVGATRIAVGDTQQGAVNVLDLEG